MLYRNEKHFISMQNSTLIRKWSREHINLFCLNLIMSARDICSASAVKKLYPIDLFMAKVLRRRKKVFSTLRKVPSQISEKRIKKIAHFPIENSWLSGFVWFRVVLGSRLSFG